MAGRPRTYTEDKHNDNIVSGVLGEAGSKAPATNRFFAFWCAQNGSPTQHEATEHE